MVAVEAVGETVAGESAAGETAEAAAATAGADSTLATLASSDARTTADRKRVVNATNAYNFMAKPVWIGDAH
jgi:hypothetical protein